MLIALDDGAGDVRAAGVRLPIHDLNELDGVAFDGLDQIEQRRIAVGQPKIDDRARRMPLPQHVRDVWVAMRP